LEQYAKVMLPMWKRQGKLPDTSALSAGRIEKEPGGRRGSGGGSPVDEGEIVLPRFRVTVPWTVAALVAGLAGPALAQNLDAGKSGAQIFSEVCANCHRSVRELKGGASVGFLREHYTTGSDMASTMASYLASGGSDPRGAAAAQPQPKRQPQVTNVSPVRDTPVDGAKDPRHQQQAADPKPLPGTPAAPASAKLQVGTARADAGKPAAAETKPPSAVRPAQVLEDFEE
jgi:mono/diheme cytochrome c family protein